jgi:hypothetical protein
VEANSTGGQGSRRAVAPSDDDEESRLCNNCHSNTFTVVERVTI